MTVARYFGLLLMVTLSFSCEPGPEEVVDLPGRQIAKIETFDKDASGNTYVSSRITFENNKPVTKDVIGGVGGSPWLRYVYTYNEQGLLSSNVSTVVGNGNTDSFSATYDSQGRMVSATYAYQSASESATSTRTFTYQGNTIIGHYPDGGMMTYLLDDTGKIIQLIVDGEVRRELTYEGNNIVMYRDMTSISTFEYGAGDLSGNFVSFPDDIVGGKNNRILLYDLNDHPWAHDRYLENAQYAGAIYPRINNYEEDDQGYPIAVYQQYGPSPASLSSKIYYE